MRVLSAQHRYRKGFLLGKFMPPHAGHLHLARSALSRCDEVTVLVCTRAGDSIPGELRATWMRELLPDARIVHVTDDVPSYPHEHPHFWEIWTKLLRRYCPDTAVVFSSESYGDEIARRLGIDQVMVDRNRARHPVSGSAVRADALREWAHLPPPVRAYYAQRVVLLGPESVGKSTLAKMLAAHYGTEHVEEYGREYTERMGPQDLVAADFERIAEGQVEREDATARRCNGLLICDTDPLTTEAFAQLMLGIAPTRVTELADARSYALNLLLDIDAPWVDDGTRWYPGRRAEHMALIRRALERRGREFVLVRGDYDERFRRAVGAIDAHLARCTSASIGASRQARREA
jgi:NadR type nicotinamide-nucleotide adenylyltransferase